MFMFGLLYIDFPIDGLSSEASRCLDLASKVMITGDYLKTAIAIAKNVQILQPQDDEVGLNIKNQDVRNELKVKTYGVH